MKQKTKKDVKNVEPKQVSGTKNVEPKPVNETGSVEPKPVINQQDAPVNTFDNKVLKDIEAKAKANFKDLSKEMKVSLIMDAYFKQSQTDKDTLNVINMVLRHSKGNIQISMSSTKDDLDKAKKSYLSVVRAYAMYLTKDNHICRVIQVYEGMWKFEEVSSPARLISLFVSETVHNIMIAHKPITIDTSKYYEKDEKGKFVVSSKSIEEIEQQIADNKSVNDSTKLKKQVDKALDLVKENGYLVMGKDGQMNLQNKDLISLITDWALYHPAQFATIVSNVEKRTVKTIEKRSKKEEA